MCHAPRLSQADVARDLGIAVNSVRQWMTGICRPSQILRDRIEGKYGIPGALWDETIPPSVDQIGEEKPNRPAEEIAELVSSLDSDKVMNLRALGLLDEQIAEVVTIINSEVALPASDE